MTHVVTESCILCKHTNCVDVCPVDYFRETPLMLVIDPDECIDCAVCIGHHTVIDVPHNKRGHLHPMRGKKVHLVCVGHGRYSTVSFAAKAI